jgi:hypothetical protein
MQVNAARQVETTLDGSFNQSFKMEGRHFVFWLKKLTAGFILGIWRAFLI